MKQNHSDSEIQYTELGGTAVLVEPVKKSYIPKKKCMCGSFLSILLGVALLLIFYPKVPEVFLKKITVDTNGNTSGLFSFRNNNYYIVKWNNPDMYLYWLPYDGQTVGSICYGNDDSTPCDTDYDNKCAIKLGEFKSDIKFETKPRIKKKRTLQMQTSSQQEQACAAWMILNPYNNLPQKLVTSGHIHAKSNIKNFGKVHVKDQYYYL